MSEDSFEAPSDDDIAVRRLPLATEPAEPQRDTEDCNVPLDEESLTDKCEATSQRSITPETIGPRQLSLSTDCTFSPAINRRSARRRTHAQYYAEMLAFEQRKQQRLEQRRTQLIPEIPAFRPSVCSMSQRLSHTQVKSVFQRLQEWCPKSKEGTDAKFTFRPKINMKSQELRRPGSVCERLYGSASQKRAADLTVSRSQSPLPASEDMAFRRFQSELHEALSAVPDPMNYSHMRLVLERLNMLGNDRSLSYRVWTYVTGDCDSLLPAETLRVFLYAAMNFRPGSGYAHAKFRDLRINRLATGRVQRTEQSPPRRSITPEAQQRLVERLTVSNSEKKQRPQLRREEVELLQCTFKPQLVAASPETTAAGESLAAAYCRLLRMSKGSRHEKLYRLAALVETRRLEEAPVPTERAPSPPAKHRSLSQVCAPPKLAVETAARLRRAREEAEWTQHCLAKGWTNCAATERRREVWKSQRNSSTSVW